MVKKVTQFVGFVYGGVLKIGNVRFFSGSHDSVDELFAAMREHYGPSVAGRYVKCENSAETMTQLQESLSDKRKGETDLYELNVNSGSTALKEKSGATKAFRLGEEKEEGDADEEAGHEETVAAASSTKKKGSTATASATTAANTDSAPKAAATKGKGKGKTVAPVDESGQDQGQEQGQGQEQEKEPVVVKKTPKKAAAK